MNLVSLDFERLLRIFSISVSVSSVINCQHSQYSNCKSKIISLDEYLHQPTDVSRAVRYRNNHF